MDLHFRVAKSSDLPELVDLLANDILGKQREDNSRPLSSGYYQAFEAIARDDNNQLLLAEVGSSLVGMVQITFIPYLTHKGTWRALLEGVRVHEDYRGRQIGEQLIQHALQLAKNKGCGMVQLTSDKSRPKAIAFYEKLGFIASHEGLKLAL
ncbi:GNAT family N-acetyltransferase [Vibrio sp. WXL103]|uniref:GNAT family N-acetyltransferase n=1 Tax=unclassified Vibrio TaxID=2614977 RepID=UPI003EC5AEA6